MLSLVCYHLHYIRFNCPHTDRLRRQLCAGHNTTWNHKCVPMHSWASDDRDCTHTNVICANWKGIHYARSVKYIKETVPKLGIEFLVPRNTVDGKLKMLNYSELQVKQGLGALMPANSAYNSPITTSNESGIV